MAQLSNFHFQSFLRYNTRSPSTERKNKVRVCQNLKLLCFKEYYQGYRMGRYICKSCIWLGACIQNYSEKKKPLKNRQRIWKDIFPNNIYKWPKKHVEACLTSLVIREMQNQSHNWYHFTPTRMVIIKRRNNKHCKELERLERSHYSGGKGLVVKNPPANAGDARDVGSILCLKMDLRPEYLNNSHKSMRKGQTTQWKHRPRMFFKRGFPKG